MKKHTLRWPALALCAALILSPQTGFAAKKKPLTAEEKIEKYEVSAVHYQYDENAEAITDPGRTSRFVLQDGIYTNPEAKVTNEATLMITGDLMCQWRQQVAAFTSDGSDFTDIEEIRQLKAEEQIKIDESGGTYTPDFGVIAQPKGTWDFDESFQYVRNILRQGDLVIGNLETMLSQSSPLTMQCYTLEGRPYLNSPVQFLEGIDYAGYDLLTLANNHSCDTGVRGLLETLANIDAYQFLRTGMFASDEEERYLVVDVNGIKVGIVSYAAYYNTKDANFTEEGQEILLNRYNSVQARADIKAARKAGADFVIAFMHWGAENTHEVTYLQQRNAYNVAKAGADYVVGSHPHAIQTNDMVQTPDGREVPVIYSMGNFLSCMQLDVNNDSLVLQLNLKKDEEGNVSIVSHRLHPCTIMETLELTNYRGKIRTDYYVVTPHSKTYGPGSEFKTTTEAGQADLQYMEASLERFRMVFENRTILPLPGDPYGLTETISLEDEELETEIYLLNRLRWVLANLTA